MDVQLSQIGMFQKCIIDNEIFKVVGYTSIKDGHRIILDSADKIKVLDSSVIVQKK